MELEEKPLSALDRPAFWYVGKINQLARGRISVVINNKYFKDRVIRTCPFHPGTIRRGIVVFEHACKIRSIKPRRKLHIAARYMLEDYVIDFVGHILRSADWLQSSWKMQTWSLKDQIEFVLKNPSIHWAKRGLQRTLDRLIEYTTRPESTETVKLWERMGAWGTASVTQTMESLEPDPETFTSVTLAWFPGYDWAYAVTFVSKYGSKFDRTIVVPRKAPREYHIKPFYAVDPIHYREQPIKTTSELYCYTNLAIRLRYIIDNRSEWLRELMNAPRPRRFSPPTQEQLT